MQNNSVTIKTDGISEAERASPKFRSLYGEMLAQLKKPTFVRALCAHEAAHLLYFQKLGCTKYEPHQASIHFNPATNDYDGLMAGVAPMNVPLPQGSISWEWLNTFACACAAGGVVGRKLDPATDGGDGDDKDRFKRLCDHIAAQNPAVQIDFEKIWKAAQRQVQTDLQNPEVMKAIDEIAEKLRGELGL